MAPYPRQIQRSRNPLPTAMFPDARYAAHPSQSHGNLLQNMNQHHGQRMPQGRIVSLVSLTSLLS